MITSIHNPKIQLVRELLSKSRSRSAQMRLVCEGVRLVEEALHSEQDFVFVLVADELLTSRGKFLVEELLAYKVPIETVKADVIQRVSDTETSQGIIAILKKRTLPLPKTASMIFVPAEISDPGNMGTMLRTAMAAGVELVLIPPSTVDVFSPKVMRAAMGAHFHLAIHLSSWKEIQEILQDIPCYVAEAEAKLSYDQVDFRQHFALIIGSEARGAGKEAQELATQRISVPMAKNCESLNAAVAAGIILFEAVRQRRASKERS